MLAAKEAVQCFLPSGGQWCGLGWGLAALKDSDPADVPWDPHVLAVCHQSYLRPAGSPKLMKPCFEGAKCLSLLQSTAFPMLLDALEAGKRYLLLSGGAELASCTLA